TSITTSGSQDLTKMANMEIAKITASTKESGGTAIKVIGFADGYNPRCTSEKANTTAVKCTYEFTATP
ncbi:MAG: hypothetical protein J1E41_02430, partial [Ruminococcus sp.]|nr:hypothetical protein [Ruminococcus sp.]